MPNSSSQPSLKVKNKLFLILVVVAGSGLLARAQTAEELDIVRHSAFDASTSPRDPFLPIGWKKVATVVAPSGGGMIAAPTTESYIKPEAFVVTSISLDRIPLAVINGKAYGEGDMIPFVAGTEHIRLQIVLIRDGEVTLRYKNYSIACLIRSLMKPAASAK